MMKSSLSIKTLLESKQLYYIVRKNRYQFMKFGEERSVEIDSYTCFSIEKVVRLLSITIYELITKTRLWE